MDIVDLGLDWVTLMGQDADGSDRILQDASELIDRLAGEHKEHAFYFRGFRGRKAGGLAVGVRADSDYCIVLQGAMAKSADLHLPVIRGLRATRTDYQVTVRLDNPDVAWDIYASLQQQNQHRERKRTIVYITSETGSTVYINKRSANVYIRIYDKSEAYKSPLGTYWRFEIEYKSGLAQPAYHSWLHSLNRTTWISGQIQLELDKRGITRYRFGLDSNVGLVAEKAIPDHEKTINWLKTCVYPAILRLIETGQGQEAYDALGMEPPIGAVWALDNNE